MPCGGCIKVIIEGWLVGLGAAGLPSIAVDVSRSDEHIAVEIVGKISQDFQQSFQEMAMSLCATSGQRVKVSFH